MAKQDEVIKSLEFCLMQVSADEIDDDVCPHPDCPYFHIYSGGKCISAMCRDALALLKAQEPIEARLNLCDSCAKLYPECDATAYAIKFGCGVGNDNVIGCMAYVNRWMAQQPRVMALAEIWERGDSEPLYLEYLIQNRIELRPAVFQPDNSESRGHMCMASAWRASGFYNKEEYGITWRCWTAWPDEKTRVETPWDSGVRNE